MSDDIKIYRFRFQENSPLFLETWRAYRADDPMIEEAYKIRVTLPEDCTIERLIRSAETARKLIVGELGSKLDWGPHYQLVTENYATSKPLRGVEVFRQKLKNLHDVALSKYRRDGVECSFKSRDEVIRWLDRFIEWAESKIEPEVDDQSEEDIEPKDVPARFRQDRKPDGEPLTPAYMLKTKSIWTFYNRNEFTRAFEKGKLTIRFRIGKTYAYDYAECLLLSAKNEEHT